MTKVVDTKDFPNIALLVPRQRRQKLGVNANRSNQILKFITQENLTIAFRQVYLSAVIKI